MIRNINMKRRDVIKRSLKEYCTYSTIHGVRYLMDEGHWAIKAAWAVILILSLLFCIMLSHILMLKFFKTPTVTMVQTTTYPTFTIAFPAVTVCPQNLVYEPRTENITNILRKRGYNNKEIEQFYDTIDIDLMHRERLPDSVVNIFETLNKLGYSIKNIMKLLSQPCEDLVLKCWWRSKEVPCELAFRPVLIHLGYCCRFDIEYLRNNINADILPSGTSTLQGLTIQLDSGLKKDNETLEIVTSVVFVGSPERDPSINDPSEMVSPGLHLDIAIEPYLVESSDEVKAMSLSSRKCLLRYNDPESDYSTGNEEPQSYNGCISNGFIHHVIDTCHCTLFYMKKAGNRWDKYPDCTVGENICLSQFNAEYVTTLLSNISENYKCYSACDEVDYSYSIDYVMTDRNLPAPGRRLSSTVNVFYRSNTCLKYRTEILFSWDQLLASLGGIFGLCLGGSIVTIVELLFLLGNIISTLLPKDISLKKKVQVFPKNGKANFIKKSRRNKSEYPIKEFIGLRTKMNPALTSAKE